MKYLSAADTARLVRVALRDAFPTTRFSVTSKTYSGGASIRVRYTDGPSWDRVDAAVAPFRGADFDSMVDLKVYVDAYVDAKGKVVGHRSAGSGAYILASDDKVPDADLVHFGADYVFVDRDVSPAFDADLDAIVTRRYGDDPPYGTKWRISRGIDFPVDVARFVSVD